MNNDTSEGKIFVGGPIITINDNQPLVEAVGISGEKIIAVGNLEEVKDKMDKDYEIIDLKDKALLPGFIDCHMHPIFSLIFLMNLNLSSIKSLEELQELLKETAKSAEPNEFIMGLNLMEENFEVPVLPTRWDLDKACSENPVFLLRHDGHLCVINSKALEIAEIDKNTVSPDGGEIQKNENGEPNGILTENARNMIISKITLPSREKIVKVASTFYKDLASKGLTTVHGVYEMDREGGVENLGGIAIPILKTIKEEILQNFYSIVYTATPKKLKRIKKLPLDEGKDDGKFKVGCIKFWYDGTFGSSTAYMFDPYLDQPDNYGFCVIDDDTIYNLMKSAHNLGYQIAIHAIGDKGNRGIVDLYKKLLTEFPRENHRHRIEHASMLTPDVINDMKELGLIASCQPPFIISDCPFLEERLGKKRFSYVYPFKSIIDAGVILAAGSDCPVEDPDPILGLHAMVTRVGYTPQECVSIKESLKAYTINGAYAAFQENVKGSIEVGKLADLVILDKNPLEIPNNDIKNLKVVETIIRGKTAYKKE